MRKIISLCGVFLTSCIFYAQVGINTNNPQASFHIDAAKDNPSSGAPSAGQQANDFVVTSVANVGIGTTSPTEKLDIASEMQGSVISIRMWE